MHIRTFGGSQVPREMLGEKDTVLEATAFHQIYLVTVFGFYSRMVNYLFDTAHLSIGTGNHCYNTVFLNVRRDLHFLEKIFY